MFEASQNSRYEKVEYKIESEKWPFDGQSKSSQMWFRQLNCSASPVLLYPIILLIFMKGASQNNIYEEVEYKTESEMWPFDGQSKSSQMWLRQLNCSASLFLFYPIILLLFMLGASQHSRYEKVKYKTKSGKWPISGQSKSSQMWLRQLNCSASPVLVYLKVRISKVQCIK